MKSHANRLSILSLPEAQEVYSVPQFTAQERQGLLAGFRPNVRELAAALVS